MSLLVTKARKSHESWRDTLIQSHNDRKGLPLTVASWCIHCKENTRLVHDKTVHVDENPRWVLGTPSKYVERRPKCLTCQVNGRPGTGRFVPVDASIPSVYGRKLMMLERRWGILGDEVKAAVLGCEPKGTTRKPKVGKAKPRTSKKARLA